ncbi:MAG: low temperature requirement protein A [Actinomycetota bacterium]|nr:low temperature requirement protein A [Actinomycetota bacterium]
MPEQTSRVSTLELFFDLVFVFTITQVALIVEHRPSWTTTAQAFIELLVIYWMYGGFAWLTNSLRASLPRQRVALLLGMAAFLVVSLAVPRAFEGDGVVFGVAYLALNIVHLVSFLVLGQSTTFAAMLRIGAANLAAAGLILAAGFVHGAAHWPFWIAAVAIQYVLPIFARTVGSFTIGVEHFAERHGLMIIIVLGESLVSVALAAQRLPVDATLIVGALCGLAASAAMWWCYFGGEDAAAAAALERLPPRERGYAALVGYDAPHVVMMAGIVSVAAGSRLSLPELTAPAPNAAAWFIGGGVAVYLLALAVFRALLRFAVPLGRALFGLLALATVPVGTGLGAAQQLLVIAGLIVVLLLAERRGSSWFGQLDRAGWPP